jgi:hypothetical protein
MNRFIKGFMRTACAAAFVAAIGVALPCRAQNGPFGVKSGIVESTLTGLNQGQQTMVLYFDNFGSTQATYTTNTIDLGTEKMVLHTIEIRLADGTVYAVNLDSMTGTSMKNSPLVTNLLNSPMPTDLQSQMNTTPLADRAFLGKTCSGVQANVSGVVTKAWTWKGLTLYSEAAVPGGTTIVLQATKLTVNVQISGDKFTVPPGVTMVALN